MKTQIITLSLIAASVFACKKETYADGSKKELPAASTSIEKKDPKVDSYFNRTWSVMYPAWPMGLTVQLNKLYPGKEIGC